MIFQPREPAVVEFIPDGPWLVVAARDRHRYELLYAPARSFLSDAERAGLEWLARAALDDWWREVRAGRRHRLRRKGGRRNRWRRP